MARKPRIHFPGAVYHVMVRGNGRADIFFEDNDHNRFYLFLQEGTERFRCRIHAFCLMPNHVHLAIQVGETPLSRLMQNLNFRYTQWINWRYQRVGHLFQGRYQAILVDRNSYLLELVRYIHLNPVRAGLVKEPTAYPWSSHRAYLGKETLPWLTTEWVLSQLSQRLGLARQKYAFFIEEGIGEGFREEFHRGEHDTRILGDDRFVGRVLGRRGRKASKGITLDGVITAVCRMYHLNESALKASDRRRWAAEARSMVAWLVRELDGVSLSDVAKRLARDLSSLSAGARRLEDRARRDKDIAKRRKGLEKVLQL